MRSQSFVALVLPLVGALLAGPLPAARSSQSSVNLKICSAARNQANPQIVGDGVGGAIITWQDSRSGNSAIYAQHMLASGVVDPTWTANGIPVCSAAGNRTYPQIVADRAGGAIVTWQDSRSGSLDIYAQHVLASGAVDPAWTTNGTPVCNAANNQLQPTIVADSAGGAIVAWQDSRYGGPDIYTQHVLASGVVDPAWTTNGTLVCDAANNQYNPQIVADGSGGAIITWYDYRGGATSDIYTHHVLASGATDPAWTTNGTLLCNAAGNQLLPTIVADRAGGAIVTWQDYRGGKTSDIYAQHVLASGAVDPAWTANGAPLCKAANDQQDPRIVADGAGGAMVTWQDSRSGNPDIYAQHVLASGVVDPTWTANGRLLCNAANNQYNPQIVAGGAVGAIVTWQDSRSGNPDIYAQRVLVPSIRGRRRRAS